VKTEVLSPKLPIHEATIVRRQAAELGLTKSSYGVNLILRALQTDSADRLPMLIDQLSQVASHFDQLSERISRLEAVRTQPAAGIVNGELRAFMIEVLVLLRYLTKHDLALGAEIGRKLQKTVGDVRVEGT